jgi:hypothetical protein
MKQVKWNKKRKWVDTRYCKPFKARLAFRNYNAAMIAAGAQLQASSIAAQRATDAFSMMGKSVAMANIMLNSATVIADELSKGGKR